MRLLDHTSSMRKGLRNDVLLNTLITQTECRFESYNKITIDDKIETIWVLPAMLILNTMDSNHVDGDLIYPGIDSPVHVRLEKHVVRQ